MVIEEVVEGGDVMGATEEEVSIAAFVMDSGLTGGSYRHLIMGLGSPSAPASATSEPGAVTYS